MYVQLNNQYLIACHFQRLRYIWIGFCVTRFLESRHCVDISQYESQTSQMSITHAPLEFCPLSPHSMFPTYSENRRDSFGVS